MDEVPNLVIASGGVAGARQSKDFWITTGVMLPRDGGVNVLVNDG
jgi:hypothetical protein